MNKKHKIALIVIGILLIVAIFTGASYALWSATHTQEDPNTLSTNCFNIEFTEQTANVNMETAFPISDTEGLQTEPYTFTLENTCSTNASFAINLDIDSTNTMTSSFIKVAVNNNPARLLTRFGGKQTIHKGTLHANSKDVYSVRMWIDEKATVSDVSGKTFKSKIIIESEAVEPTLYADASGAEIPVLSEGMIPVIYNSTEKQWVKADPYSQWYDYDNQWWANAVNVSESTRQDYLLAPYGTAIDINDINFMWVWIPRYKYRTDNLTTKYADGTKDLPGAIRIEFISKEETESSSSLYSHFNIHDAFWWDNNNDGIKDRDEQLPGFWFAKFELSTGDTTCTPAGVINSAATIGAGCDLITIKPKSVPNVLNWRSARLGTFWTAIHNNMNGENGLATYGLSNSDTHVMKNLDWGAVAYLSQSKYGKYGNANFTGKDKEVFPNADVIGTVGRIAGCSVGNNVSGKRDTCTFTYEEDIKGTGASTTGNIYGIYDMNVGAFEYTMAFMQAESEETPLIGNNSTLNSGFNGQLTDGNTQTSGFDMPEKKYYDLYKYNIEAYAFSKTYKPGDALYEVSGGDGSSSGWYNDMQMNFTQNGSIIARGAMGIFGNTSINGTGTFIYSTRAVSIPLVTE